LSRQPDSELADRLSDPDAQELLNFDAALGAAKLRLFLMKFDDLVAAGAPEPKYQDLLKTNPWVLSQLYAAPVVFVQNQPYVGGKQVSN
jgi:hypothetical protein